MNVIEYLQDVLIGKMREVPANDIEKVREYIKEIEALKEATDAPRAAARKALTVLRDVEWVKDHPDEPPCCPVCSGEYGPDYDHADDCALAEAISDLEAVL